MSKALELVEHWRQAGPVEWAEGPYGWIEARKPITLTPWQRAVLASWWEHRASITTLAISNVKKTGKTFVNAVLLAWRWLALPAEHFAVGNDLDQSAGRQFQMIAEMVRGNPYLSRNVKATGSKLTFLPTGSTIEALAVDAAGNAGANHLTASHTEAWGIVYESGIRAFEELTPPPGRKFGFPAMRIADSYTGIEGESKTWHAIVDRGLQGERIGGDWPVTKAGGLLLFHIEGTEAQERCFRGSTEDAAAYYEDQRTQLRPAAFLRLHENKRSTGSESFIDLAWWDACLLPGLLPLADNGSGELYVGVDASTKHDSAAVVAVLWDEDLKRVRLAQHRIWQPSRREPLDIDGTIGDYLRSLHQSYTLARVHYDPFQLHDLSTRLRSEGLPLQEYPQTVPNLTAIGQNLYDLIRCAGLAVYPDATLRNQVSQAVAIETPRGWRIAKEKSSHRIDAVVALAMAALPARESRGHHWSGKIETLRMPHESRWVSDYQPGRWRHFHS